MTATGPKPPARAATPSGAPAELSFSPVVTLVLWLGCLLVGWLGFVLPYVRPRPPAPPAPALQAELIKVELAIQPAPPPTVIQPPPPDPSQPPPLFEPSRPPRAPQLVAVAAPSPAVAFAPPIETPSRIVEIKQAAFVRPAPQPVPIAPSPVPTAPSTGTGQPTTSAATAPAMETLTYGQGEGRQPAPEYPLAARRAGQEGTVVIRFSVGEDGRVLAAEPSSPSPWGALNRAALRTVREQWRFKPGPVRLHEVAIRFELEK